MLMPAYFYNFRMIIDSCIMQRRPVIDIRRFNVCFILNEKLKHNGVEQAKELKGDFCSFEFSVVRS